jgi:hypothetical protein
MIETPHSIADFILYMQDYYHEARHQLVREPGITNTLNTLRKLIALGFACLEQHYGCGPVGHKRHGYPMSFDELYAAFLTETIIEHPNTDFSTFMFKINLRIENAAFKAVRMDSIDALHNIYAAVLLGIECFNKFGIESRDLTQPIINARDGLPA